MVIAIADSSFLIAIADNKDKHHKKSLEIYKDLIDVYVPDVALTEVIQILTGSQGSNLVLDFLLALPYMKYTRVVLKNEDILRTHQILEQYQDTRIDFVDASIMALSERLGITTVLTLDKRDFSLFRPKHTEYLHLLPTR